MALAFNISKNLAQSTLASGYTAGNTTITVQTGDGTKFDGRPVRGGRGQPAAILSEGDGRRKRHVHGRRLGYDGSTAVSVTAATPLTEVITAGVLQALLASVSLGWPWTQLAASDFTWVNQGTATAATNFGGVTC